MSLVNLAIHHLEFRVDLVVLVHLYKKIYCNKFIQSNVLKLDINKRCSFYLASLANLAIDYLEFRADLVVLVHLFNKNIMLYIFRNQFFSA